MTYLLYILRISNSVYLFRNTHNHFVRIGAGRGRGSGRGQGRQGQGQGQGCRVSGEGCSVLEIPGFRIHRKKEARNPRPPEYLWVTGLET